MQTTSGRIGVCIGAVVEPVELFVDFDEDRMMREVAEEIIAEQADRIADAANDSAILGQVMLACYCWPAIESSLSEFGMFLLPFLVPLGIEGSAGNGEAFEAVFAWLQ